MDGMNSDFERFLSKHSPFTKEQISEIAESLDIREYKKKTVILRAGDLVTECYLILKGCLRSYVIKDGLEKTIEFYMEEQSVALPGYGKQIPSELFLECVEDTVAVIGTPEIEAKMSNEFPELISASLKMTEDVIDNYQSTIVDYKMDSAEERYIRLTKERPGLIQRVPQYQLASYLGVQPESLSRIRRRISKK